MSDVDRRHLRPVERVVLRHLDNGLSSSEIAWRLRRTPGYVDQIVEFSDFPRRPVPASVSEPGGLRPVERRTLRSRQAGLDYPEIAARMRRTPAFVARVEKFANYKLRSSEATT